MAGFDNDVIFGSNIDFTGTSPVSGQINLNGELLVGATTAPFIRAYVPTGSNGLVVNTGPGTLDFSLANIPNTALANSTINVIAGSGLSGGGVVGLGGSVSLATTGSTSGNLTLLSSKTVSGASSIDFTALITSTYKDYYAVFQDIVTSSNNDIFKCLVSTDNGSTYPIINYNSCYLEGQAAATGAITYTDKFILAAGVDITIPTYGFARFFSLLTSSTPGYIGNTTGFQSGTTATAIVSGNTTNNPVNALRFMFNAGTVTGTIKFYGIVN